MGREAFLHPFAIGARTRALYTPKTYSDYRLEVKNRLQCERLLCACGCGIHLVVRESKNVPLRRYIRTHFMKKGKHGCWNGWKHVGESKEHAMAKRAVFDHFDKIVFGTTGCVNPRCKARQAHTFSKEDGYCAYMEKRDGSLRPDVTIEREGEKWAVEIFHTNKKNESDIASLKRNGFLVVEFEASEVMCKFENMPQNGNIFLTNMIRAEEYEPSWSTCSACEELVWWQEEWAPVADFEDFLGAQYERMGLEKEILLFEEKDKIIRKKRMQDADEAIQRMFSEPKTKRRKWIEKQHIAKCGHCEEWVDKRKCKIFDSDDYGGLQFEWQRNGTTMLCEACVTSCYACGEHVPLLQVSNFSRCRDCNDKKRILNNKLRASKHAVDIDVPWHWLSQWERCAFV
jgi:hypothetical protein